MKTVIGILFLFVLTMGVAHAEEVWFTLDPTGYPFPEDATHYKTADEACHTAYDADVASNPDPDAITYLPYLPPKLRLPVGSNFDYDCEARWVDFLGGQEAFEHEIYLMGDQCQDGLFLDVFAGGCVSPNEPQARRQEGDPDDEPNNVPDSCAGNPINAALGNKFEKQTDYVDADGELRFDRFYNGLTGGWRTSYSASLLTSPASIMVTFDDGRASLFALSGGVALAEPTERGSLVKSGGNWVYSSPSNEKLTFDFLGRLSKLTTADGLSKTITYGYDSSFNNMITVKDSRGHSFAFTEDGTGKLLTLAASGVTVTYAYSQTDQLSTVSRAFAGKTTSRSHLYEDTNNPLLLTGLIDEKGVRAATWTYDAQGRAVSSEHSGGADKTTISYADDGTTTVTNALGHVVTYHYAVVAGTRQMVSVNGEPEPGCPISNSSFSYDDRGQIVSHTDALGHVTVFAYDPQGRITSKTEAKGTAQERVTTTTWDGTSFRKKTVTTPDRVTTYIYDTQGRLLSTQTHSVKE